MIADEYFIRPYAGHVTDRSALDIEPLHPRDGAAHVVRAGGVAAEHLATDLAQRVGTGLGARNSGSISTLEALYAGAACPRGGALTTLGVLILHTSERNKRSCRGSSLWAPLPPV
ncbi:hypothetical protein [Saccharopolyspora shandongensis]|uniref:hypothetical protein n=1 Tax=Saccharopolyspora shandongensis TaxID=418495 RepID=UPI003410D008